MFNDAPQTPPLSFDDAITAPEVLKAQHLESFNYGNGRFEVSDAGVYFVEKGEDDSEKSALFICSRLDVIGLTSATHGDNWGRMVEFTDGKHRRKKMPIPATLWQGDGLRLRETLADYGLIISSNNKARKLLMDYIQAAPAITHFESVEKLGWHDDAYVLPTQSISTSPIDATIYQSPNQPPPYAQTGTLEQWRDNVATYAKGNSRLVFAISVALAAPMMHLCGMRTSTGFHIRGDSSSGKTTALEAAVSVYGKPEHFMKTWRNTANALEGTALAHNDGLLALDELSQINPKDLDQVSYMLGNGQKKGRATVTGNAKPVSTWRLLYLSTGEESLNGMLAKAGIKTNAGQEMRFIDIEADAGNGLGVFDDTHGMDGAKLSNIIKGNAAKYHGTAGIEWLTYLVENRQSLDLKAAIKPFCDDTLPLNATSQHKRVCDYFGLVAIAGELATAQGFTGWGDGETWQACKRIFNEWLEGFGKGNKEATDAVQAVKDFILKHGASRFEHTDGEPHRTIINRVGWFKQNEGGDGFVYYLTDAGFNDMTNGHNKKVAISALINAGILIPAKDSDKQKPRIKAIGKTERVYEIRV